MNLGIVGSRSFKNYQLLIDQVRKSFPDLSELDNIVSGGADGADTLANDFSKEFLKKPAIEKLPDYNKYGRYEAPKQRNLEIIEASDALIAFWDGESPGTRHSLKAAQIKGIPIQIVFFEHE